MAFGQEEFKLLIQVNADLAELRQTVDGMQRLRSEGQGMQSAFKTGLGIGMFTQGLNLVEAGMKRAIWTGVEYNATLEQQRVAYETLLGSAEAAEARISSLARFAAATPFELDEIVRADKVTLQQRRGHPSRRPPCGWADSTPGCSPAPPSAKRRTDCWSSD